MPQHSPSDSETSRLGPLAQVLTSYSESACHDSEVFKCCCGRGDDCEVARENKQSVSELERDLHLAASLGKALLDKHERTMLDADEEKKSLRTKVGDLEDRAHHLEVENERKTEENRALLSSLEDLNHSLTASESRVRDLEEELDLAQAELSRLNSAAARTELLETQLAILEREQEELRSTLVTTREEERAAALRSRRAERTLAELTEKFERIETENRIEKARAQNLLERLEKRRLLNKRSFPSELANRTAMSQYMKDVLAENSNLQGAIAELQNLLFASQEEASILREELEQSNSRAMRSPLSRELGVGIRPAPQEVHFHHHHYHSKGNVRNRPKKKRLSLMDGTQFTPLSRIVEPSSASPPTSALSSPMTSPMSQFNRWSSISGQSSATVASSFPTSPTSFFDRNSVGFDKAPTTDYTRPSSADSEYGGLSPIKGHTRISSVSSPPFDILSTSEEDAVVQPRPVSRLYRSASHESILSMLDSQPSVTSTLRSNGSFATPFPATVSSTNSQVAPQPIAASGRAAKNASKAAGSLAYNRLLLNSAAAQRSEAAPNTFGGTLPKWLWKWPVPLPGLGSSRSGDETSTALPKDNARPKVRESKSASPVVPFLMASSKAIPAKPSAVTVQEEVAAASR